MQEIERITRTCQQIAVGGQGMAVEDTAEEEQTACFKFGFKYQETSRKRKAQEKLKLLKGVLEIKPSMLQKKTILKVDQAPQQKQRQIPLSPVANLTRYRSLNDFIAQNNSSFKVKPDGANCTQSPLRNVVDRFNKAIRSPPKRLSPTIDPSKLLLDVKQRIPPSLKDTASTLQFEYLPNCRTMGSKTRQPMEKQQPGHRLTDYKILWEMGKGRFSVVKAARHKLTNFLVAIKMILKADIKREGLTLTIQREIAVHSSLTHPYIIQYYTNFQDEQTVYIVFELAPQGQLYKKLCQLTSFSEKTTSIICRQILEAVAHMHHRGILHRDIKPQNIVLVSGVAKLCDMGWSIRAGNSLRKTLCGTPIYASPELLSGQAYNEKNDLWAIGILAYEMYYGKPPFNINRNEQLSRIITDNVTFPSSKPGSNYFRQFISITLNKNPEQRMDCDEMLRHPFITKYKDSDVSQQLI